MSAASRVKRSRNCNIDVRTRVPMASLVWARVFFDFADRITVQDSPRTGQEPPLGGNFLTAVSGRQFDRAISYRPGFRAELLCEIAHVEP